MVVLLLPVADGDLGVGQGPEQVQVETFVAQATVAAIISGPLSNRSTVGPPPRVNAIWLSSAPSTSAVMDRSTSPPRHSRVCSSTTGRILIGWPSVVESYWKSTAHTMIRRRRGQYWRDGGGPDPLASLPDDDSEALFAPQALDLLVVDHPAGTAAG